MSNRNLSPVVRF